MPLTLPPISRRRFLAGALATAAAAATSRWAIAAPAPDPSRVAIFSDTHIEAGRGKSLWFGQDMSANLDAAVAAVLRLDPLPAHLVINGDLSYEHGHVGDYRTMLAALEPARRAGVAVHLSLGNHDQRQNFLLACPDEQRREANLADRQVAVVATPHADLYLLDSLDRTNQTPGRLGLPQLAWLTQTLDARPDRPAVVLTHHQPNFYGLHRGLLDADSLMHVIAPRPQVKLHLFGHTHRWQVYPRRDDRLYQINLPPVGYVFRREDPLGWIDLRLGDAGATARLLTLKGRAESHELTWR